MESKIKEIINNIKIKNKLILTYLIVTIATVSIVGTYLTTQMTNIIVNRAVSEAKNNSSTIERRLAEILNLTTKVSDLIYTDEKLDSILSTKYETYGQVVEAYNSYPVLRNYVKYYREFSSITVYVENDTILGNDEVLKVSDKVRNEEWYNKAINNGGKIIWRYVRDEYTGIQYLSLVRCINDNNGNQLGVLAININPSILKDLIYKEPANNIITLDEQVISAEDRLEVYKNELDKYFEKTSKNYSMDVVKDKISGEESYIILNSFKIEKTLNNNFRIITILPIAEITSQTNKVIINSVTAIIATIILEVIVIIYFSESISERINLLRREMHRVVNGDFYLMAKINGNDEIGQLYKDLGIMIDSIKKLINEVYIGKIQKEQLRASQKEAEFKMLANQINPHFLYNTLETIRMKAFCNGDKETADIVKKLGKIMRRNLEISGKMVTLKSELDLIENYLEIQSIRFEGRVKYKVNIGENIDKESYMMLPLLLQPVVENAFIHGLEEKKKKGIIIIDIIEKEKHLMIRITDDGVGINSEKLQEINEKLLLGGENNGRSIGMINVNQRIKIHYGKEYGLTIESTFGEGTSVALSLPK